MPSGVLSSAVSVAVPLSNRRSASGRFRQITAVGRRKRNFAHPVTANAGHKLQVNYKVRLDDSEIRVPGGRRVHLNGLDARNLHFAGLALPKSVKSGNICCNDAVVRRMSAQQARNPLDVGL